MRHRHDGMMAWKPVLIVGALLGTHAAAHANPTMPGWIGSHGYGWMLIVSGLVVLVEWPAVRYITGLGWETSLAWTVALNLGSALVGVATAGIILFLAGVILETIIVTVLAVAQRRRWWCEAFLLGLVLNVATGVGIVSLQGVIPPTNMGSETVCMSNLKQIGFATRMYAEAHGGLLPPARTTDEFLRAVVGHSLAERGQAMPEDGLPRWPRCPGNDASRWALLAPRPPEGSGYTLVGTLPDALEGASKAGTGELQPGTLCLPAALAPDRVLLMDDEPRHNEGRNCLYYDGHVKWVKGEEPLSKGATRDDFVEASRSGAGDALVAGP